MSHGTQSRKNCIGSFSPCPKSVFYVGYILPYSHTTHNPDPESIITLDIKLINKEFMKENTCILQLCRNKVNH
jgi:hypothetical protein